MALKDYNSKRKFDETSEPEGKTKRSKDKLVFVIQRHAASRLHYDFRLEMDGVLKSWAVPKGPSLNPKDKRLAMMVEDHPYDYKDFEGNIPEGNYGAGQVEIWDSGTYEPLDNHSKLSDEKELLKELNAGSLKFILHGKKLKGEFALVKMKNTEENSWLLIKHKDDFAEEDYDAEDHTSKSSAVTKFLEEKKSPESSKKADKTLK
ncbi:DNA polymerase ligase N-terminal domain-containing protein [uncultured Chryseobacterium sp.]|uniref:DNA polymerase ligase N-terminal domain-containing protein n=1 Tax=uncultured Chryseobacterium sp. TaxID=259322 RepID=UPI0025D05500|nr:DNA polymerase ligase N-terminal domain-containing protein [uncultured Chryseobacterium sp.]